MYDFTNYQIADIPIFMWSMVAVTAGLIGYVTVTSNPSVAASLPSMPSMPAAQPTTTTQSGGGRTKGCLTSSLRGLKTRRRKGAKK